MRVINYFLKQTDALVGQNYRSLVTCLFILLTSYPAFAVVDALEASAFETERAQKGLLLDITQSGNRFFAVGERGHIIYSDDEGQSWLQANVPVRVTLTAIAFPSTTHGWAVGHDGVILTTQDGGLNWEKQLDGYQANQLIEDELNRFIALSDEQRNEHDIRYQAEELNYLLEDAELFSDEGASRPFLDVMFIDERTGIAVGAYGMIFQTSNGGANWQPSIANLVNPDNFHINSLIKSQNALYMAGEAGSIYRSVNQGLNWTSLQSPYDGPFFGMSVSHGQSGEEHLVVYGLRGNAFISANQGQSWSRLEMDSDAAILGSTTLTKSEFTLLTSGGELYRYNFDGTLIGRGLTPERTALSSGIAVTSEELLLVGANGITDLNLPQVKWEAP